MTREPGSRRLPKVLLVDNDPHVAQLIQSLPTADEYVLFTVRSGQQALAALERERPHVLIVDEALPDGDGLEVLAAARQFDPHMPVLFTTTQAASKSAIEAMKQGAFDFLRKPFDPSELESQLELAVEARRLMQVPVVVAGSQAESEDEADTLVGRSPAMTEIFKAIGRFATRELPVLLEGETGTGKALVARTIHQHSSRAAGPIGTLRCSDFDSATLERELFGLSHGERTHHYGRLEQSAGGTLVLEEVGQCSAAVQSKLFRLLTTQQFERVNGRETLFADARVICCTSSDLAATVAQGRFRADLYYLLRTLSVRLPALRDRREDLPLLVDHFVKRFMRLSASYNQPTVRVSREAMELLVTHRWPGNLDELQSVVQQALLENAGTVLASPSLVEALKQPQRTSPAPSISTTSAPTESWQTFVAEQMQSGSTNLYADAVTHMESQVLSLLLESTGGNQARAAKILGITRGNLRKKLRALGLYAKYAQNAEGSEELVGSGK